MKAQLDFIGLVVEDMQRSLAFYRELGVDVPDASADAPHVEATLPGGLRLAWDAQETIRSFDPDWQPATGGPQIGFAFRCASPADVDGVYERMVAAGYDGHKPPWDAPWGQRYAQLRDPDGNSADLYSPL
jgi:uncharacterized glyoxalase superfamily protein PhnB